MYYYDFESRSYFTFNLSKILGNASNSIQGGKKENSSSCSQSGKPIVSAIINMPVSEAI